MMDNDDSEYLDNFDNSKIMFKDLASAMLIDEYKKSLADFGKVKNLNIGDTVILKSMFLPCGTKILPPWAIQEAIVLQYTDTSSKVAIETKVGTQAIWIYNWQITDHIPNTDSKIKTKFKKLADKLSLRSMPSAKEMDEQDNRADDLKLMIDQIVSGSNHGKSLPYSDDGSDIDDDAIVIIDEDNGEEYVVDPTLVALMKKAIKNGDL